jgi:hypothetical protein
MAAKSISTGKLAAAARAALRRGLEQTSPSVSVDAKGYVARPSDNLIQGVDLSDVESDFRQGDGNELESKFRAAHSSSALAANTFGPFKRYPAGLHLTIASQFTSVQFERKCPHGLLNRRSPNLDVLADGHEAIVGIESKCLEYLSPHSARFADAYNDQIRDTRRDGLWFAHMQQLRSSPDTYRWLDAAQLVKHAFGLAYTFSARRIVLLYLYWEPKNAEEYPHFAEHRLEAARFAQAVEGDSPAFAAMSYQELWRAWDGARKPEWLATHVCQLRSRYNVCV